MSVLLSYFLAAIIGWFPGGATTGRASVTFAVVDSTSSNTESITLPASGIEAGDLIIIAGVGFENSTDTPDFDVPSGFTQVFEEAGTPGGSEANRGVIFIKEAAGNEDGASHQIWDGGGTISRGNFSVVLRPNRNFTSPTVVDSDVDITNGNPGPLTIGTAGPYNLALGLYGSTNPALVPASSITATEELDATIVFLRLFLFNPNTTSQQFTIDMNDPGNNNFLGGIAMTFAPQ